MKPLSLDDLAALVVKLHQLVENDGADPAEVEVFTESFGNSYLSRYQLADIQLVGGGNGELKVILKEMTH